MDIVTKIAPLALALIMLGLGLGLKLEDFTRVLKTPKDFMVGFISQLIILPLVAYLLIIILKTPPEIAIGVMIIAAAPGGVTSNIMTKFADGDVALSISLTAIISLLSIITVPFIIFTSADLFGITNIAENISMIGIAFKMFLVVTVPVILGMIIRKVAENFIASKVGIFNKLNIVLFVISSVDVFDDKALFFIRLLSLSVSVNPGKILLTVIPYSATSLDNVFAQLAIAHRTVLETPRLSMGAFTEIEIIFTILP